MFNGGDGYTALTGGTDVSCTGDLLLDVADRVRDRELAGRTGGRRPAGRSVEAGLGAMARLRVVAPALLERDAPLGVLLGALRGAEAGRGSTALISGEAGIGKTSLVRAFVGRARARLLVAACDDLVTPRTLGPLWDAAPDGGPLARALGEGREVFGALMEELSLRAADGAGDRGRALGRRRHDRRARLRGAAGGFARRAAGADRARRGAGGRASAAPAAGGAGGRAGAPAGALAAVARGGGAAGERHGTRRGGGVRAHAREPVLRRRGAGRRARRGAGERQGRGAGAVARCLAGLP